MPAPDLSLRVDWANKGTFDGAFDTVDPLLGPEDSLDLSRGASAELNAEADGSLAFELDNVDDRYTPDRNWADNPSFEVGAEGWETTAIPSLTAMATSVGQVTDNAPSAGTKAGEAVLTATNNSGVYYRIPYSFKAGVAHSLSIYLKSTAGNLNVRAGLASLGTPADIASTASNITTSWVAYTATWTPSADRDDVVIFVRTTTAATATVRIDRVQVNAGSAANTYLEAPTKGQLTAGRPVHFYATSAGDYEALVESITGLVSYWRLGEIAGTNAVDTFGGRTGTYVNTPTLGVAGAIASDPDLAVSFSAASNEYINVADHATLDLGDVWSVSAWVKLNAVTAGTPRHILSKGDDAYGFRVNTTGKLEITRANDWIAAESSVALTTAWHHVVATKNGTTLKLYIDGVDRTGTVFNSGAMANNATVLLIGSDPTNASGSTNRDPMDGTLDEVALFNVALSAGTVQTLYVGSDTAKFYGYTDRITPDLAAQRVRITCYDPLRRYAETDVIVPANTYRAHSARTLRAAALGDFERGSRNLLANPSFETNTTGWTQDGLSLTRITTDFAPGGGSAAAAWDDWDSALGQTAHELQTFARLTPIFHDGETYRFSVWLRVPATGGNGSLVGMPLDVRIGFGLAVGTAANERRVTVTTMWQRFTISYTMEADVLGSAASPLVAWIGTIFQGDVLGDYPEFLLHVDNAMISRGKALYAYSHTGTGRWPSWVGNGDFEGNSAATGWDEPFTNLIGNPSFETNTTGWSIAGDAFTGAASSLTRVVGTPKFGSARADLVANVSCGAFYAITGTFVAGATYRVGLWVRTASGTVSVTLQIGSNGTPGDQQTDSVTANTTYQLMQIDWTPSSNRTDVHLVIEFGTAGGPHTLRIDGAYVYRHTLSATHPPYYDTGPSGGGGTVPSGIQIAAGVSRYGYQSLLVSTPATANAGIEYDFNHFGVYLVAGQPYTVSFWIVPVGADMPFKVGIGSNKGDGTVDETTGTATLTGNVWQKVNLTWTPSADRDSLTTFGTLLNIWQTDATSRQFYLDGVRMIPGSVSDDFEMSHWDLDMNGVGGEAGDRYEPAATLSGSLLTVLEQLNELTLTRHWIRPEMTAPWYSYVTEDRVSFRGKASVATFTEDIQEWSDLDIDADAIVNLVRVAWATGSDWYSDGDSVARHGERAGPSIDGELFFPDRTIPDQLGEALLDRYAVQRSRPRLRAEQQYANQLLVDINDVVTATIAKFLLRSGQFVVLREDLAITQGGKSWVTTWTLEEYPY